MTVKFKLWKKKFLIHLIAIQDSRISFRVKIQKKPTLASTLPPPASGTAEVHSVAERRSFDGVRPNLPTKGAGIPFDLAFSRNATRIQLASFEFPDVTLAISNATVIPLSCSFTPTDPDRICKRPCESIVAQAEDLMKQRSTGKSVNGVKIGDCGSFDESGLAFLRKYCRLADVRQEVSAECRWLNDEQGISDADKAEIGLALWHHSPRHVLLRHGSKAIDVESFTLLSLERYVDNMVIDISIEIFLQETQRIGRQDTIYLPCELWQWLVCADSVLVERITPLLSKLNGQKLKQILIPVHMVNHWGLIYIDIEGKKMHFDDGLRRVPRGNVVDGMKRVLGVIQNMTPHHEEMSSRFWLDGKMALERFGMPSQAAGIKSKSGEGLGSCGVGVIMSARDFIVYGPEAKNSFQWTYNSMGIYRKQLMLQILKWAKA